MALCWQLFFAGPVVRFVFSLIFRGKENFKKDEMKEMPEIEVPINSKATILSSWLWHVEKVYFLKI